MIDTVPAPALTVAVPTYNRAVVLAEMLSSIRAALERTPEPVDVLVVDNNSSDSTHGVIEQYAGTIPQLRYSRQSVNVGGEANFFSCIEQARGTHVWVVGDDDVIEPDSIAKILDQLRRGADAVVLNYSVWSSDLKTCVNPRFFFQPADRVFESADDVLERFSGALGFTAAVVVNRARIVHEGRERFLRRADVGLSFLDSAYRNMASARVAYLASPQIRARGDNSRDLSGEPVGWSPENWNRVFVSGFQLVLSGLAEYGYGGRSIRRARNLVIRQYVPARLRLLRRAGAPYGATVSCVLKCAYDRPAVWTRVMPMLLIPRFVLRLTPSLRRFLMRTS